MPSANSKSMDVAKPGKTTPDATARLVIVGHKPLLKQDPMVGGEEEAPKTKTAAKAEEKPLVSRAEKVLKPLSEENPATTDNKPVNDDGAKVEKPTESQPAAESLKEPEESNTPPVSDDAAVVDALAEQASANRKETGELTAEEKKRQEALEKLIEEKKYFIPIKVASRRRQARWNIIILCLLLAGVGGYLLVDAGLVGANVKVPFEFIKDSSVPEASVQSEAPAPQPPPPQPTSAEYVSKVDGLSFTHPAAWKATTLKEGAQEEVLVSPPDPTTDTNSLFVGLTRGKQASSLTNSTIAKVDYTELKVGSRTLYLREVIYKGRDNRFSIRASIADNKIDEKVGGTMSVLDTTFAGKDGKTPLIFHIVGVNSNDGRSGFSSLDSAAAFTQSTLCKDAKNTLMSLKFK